MGLEEMEWSQATRGQEDPISHDAAVRVYHTSLWLVLGLIRPLQDRLRSHPRQELQEVGQGVC